MNEQSPLTKLIGSKHLSVDTDIYTVKTKCEFRMNKGICSWVRRS